MAQLPYLGAGSPSLIPPKGLGELRYQPAGCQLAAAAGGGRAARRPGRAARCPGWCRAGAAAAPCARRPPAASPRSCPRKKRLRRGERRGSGRERHPQPWPCGCCEPAAPFPGPFPESSPRWAARLGAASSSAGHAMGPEGCSLQPPPAHVQGGVLLARGALSILDTPSGGMRHLAMQILSLLSTILKQLPAAPNHC